ncbi:MAG: HYR domain-containing protein, partial [Bacteroidota bacterium]
DNIFTNLPAGEYEIVVKALEEEACIENFGIVTVEAGSDSEVPTFVCPSDVVIGTQATRCGAVVRSIGLTEVADNCDASPNITYSTSGALDNQIGAGDASGSIFPVGTTIVTYFVEDESGNIDSCKFSVTVEDDDAPIAQNCPSDIIIENATEFYRSGGTVSWTPPTFVDNCTDEDQLIITNNIAPDFVPTLGATTIIYTATDEAGNTSRCTFDVIVQDIYITDPCICLNNRTTDDDGQFAETVTVYSAPNETWKIISVEGLFRAPSGAFPPANGVQYDLIPYQVGEELTENPASSGEYVLNGLHLEEIGYSITVSNGSTTLSTSNNCIYDIACDMGIAMPDDGGAPKQYTIECGKETNFFDDGGTLYPYFDEERQKDVVILCPDDPTAQVVQITFQSFDIAQGDRVIVYDGDNLAAASIGSPTTGTGVPFSPGGGWVQASCENVSGCLTVELIRNGDNRKGAGWEATIECAVRDTRFSCPAQTRFIYAGDECNSVQNVQLPIPFIEICGEKRAPIVEFSCDVVDYEVDLNSNSLKISTLPVGKYIVRLSDPVYPTRYCEYDLTVIPSSFACNDAINVSLLNECTVALTPDLILEQPCEHLEIDYDLQFTDPNINIVGTTINGYPIADFSSYPCGTRIEIKIGRTIRAACGEAFEDACWSHLIIEDKIAPELIGDIDEDVIYCYDEGEDLLEKLNTNVAGENGGTIELSTGNQLLIEAIDEQFSIFDNCEAVFEIGRWQAVEYDCTTGAFSGLEINSADPLWALMFVEQGEEASFRAYFRTVKAIDKCGNESNISLQRVLVVQPDIVAPLLEIELPCGSETDPITLYDLWASGDPRYAHYRTFIPNYDPTPLDLNGGFGGFAGLEDTYFTDNSGDEIPASIEHEDCGYAIDWVDSDSSLICEGTYKFFREWTVYNWCDGHLELIDVLPQTIKVGDLAAPTLEFLGVETLGSTQQECSSDALIRVNIADDCEGEITAYIDFINDGLGEIEYEIGEEGILATDIPIGDTLRFYIRLIDACSNSETYGPFSDLFEDNIPPVAICESFHSTSLGLGCVVELPAEIFDDGSYDNCGTVSFSIAKMSDVTGDGVLFDEDFDFFFEGDEELFQPILRLTDEDLEDGSCSSTIPVIFRVEDGVGNSNFCMLEVEISDKLPPICTAMPDYNTVCDDPVVADITELLLLDEEEQLTAFRDFLLTGALGELTITENCGSYELEVVELDLDSYNLDCNQGIIRYRFRAIDNCGNTSQTCDGHVIVDGGIHDWQMDFPRDRIVRCDDRFVNFRIPRPSDLEDILVTNNGCDDWRMEVTTERFDNASEGCYELIYTYNLVNVCTWDNRNVEPAIVERPDSILDDRFETISLRYQDFYINDDEFLTCGVQRDLDDCEIILSPLGRDGINDIDDFCDDGDDSFTALDFGCDGDFVLFEKFDRPYTGDVPFFDIFMDSIRQTQRYVSAQAYGNIVYRQVIRVYDITPPSIEVEEYPSVFCGGEEEAAGDLCLADAVFT